MTPIWAITISEHGITTVVQVASQDKMHMREESLNL